MVDRRTVRDGYDALVEDYAAQRSDDESADLTAFLADLPVNVRVLDVGCGNGNPVLARLSETMTGVGIDVSRGQLRAANTNAPGAALAQADMTQLPLEDDSFDAVTALWSLIHVPEGDHRIALEEFARVLRPGGRVFVVEGTDEWHGSNPDWLESGVPMSWHIAGPEATREQLEAAGFSIREESEIWSEADEAAWQLFDAVLGE